MLFSSVIINDYFDEEIDKITNQKRPLITKVIDKKTYLKIGIVTFFIAILITFFINTSLTIWFSFYYALTLIYNVPPLRLKRFLGLATFLSALASVIIIFIGYLSITPDNSLQNFPSSLIYIFLITFTISLPLKDFKDIEGDRENKVFTLPVIFGEKNGRLILGINFFISYFLSIYFLQEKKLLFPALFFGIMNFLIMNLKVKENYLFNQRKIIPIIFNLVLFYGIILVYTIFKNNLIDFFKF
jgi:4-hydroxybenzoate polyprenyltransferase